MQWEDQPIPDGLFRMAGFDAHGLHVTDAWYLPEQLHDFTHNRLMPIIVGDTDITSQPGIEVIPTRRVFAAGHTNR